MAQAYRTAIDNIYNGKPFDPSLLAQLDGLANRGYTNVFFQRHHSREHQNYLDSNSKSRASQYVGDVMEIDNDGNVLIEVKNKFSLGDEIEVLQYILYLIATKKHLENRLNIPDASHLLGGAVYFYVRGLFIEHKTESGVFIDTSCMEIVRNLDALLLTT